MTAKHTYTQCQFEQATEDGGYRYDVAWLPTTFATIGKIIEIDGREGKWTVVSIGTTKGEKEALADSRDYLKQREASDIKKAPQRLRDKMKE